MSEKSYKSSEKVLMSTLEEAQMLLRQVAGPPRIGDNVKGVLSRLCRRLGWSFNRTRDVYHGDPRIRISADEIDQLRAATSAQKEEQDARIEFRKLSERIARIEAALAASAPHAVGVMAHEIQSVSGELNRTVAR